jgi:signal transduction histidine kinase
MNHAGLWPECVEQGRPVVRNEPATLPGHHRLPPGHPGVTRELVVPVVRGEVVVALLGVGNKPVPYTDQDVEVMVTLADLLWDIAEQRRAEEALRQSERERLQVQEIANARLREQTENLESIYKILDSVGLIICRLEESDARIEIFNPGAEKLFGYRQEERTRELQETQRKFLHAEKLSAIGKLSASIAHEFNNPLQGILSILKGLQKRAVLEEEDRELLAAAIGESDRIKSLIRSLQEFNRPSPGRNLPMDIHICLDAMLLLHKNEFRNKQISVRYNFARDLPLILAVPDQIKQVFLNLLTNAADACQQPGGVITVTTRYDGDRVAVIIEDTGIGIKEEEMSLIFQPFFTTKPEVKGTGLGLPVCFGIVKEHGGEILIESRPGEGTTCTVWLPVSGREASSQ